jgi:type I restriction enzyme S subunit
VIAKLQQMKQGLLHDLLTRGIDENGELRDPERHPEQFKDSPLGKIPRGWEVRRLLDLVQPGSIVTYGVVQPGPEVEHGILFVRGGDFPKGHVVLDRLRTISSEVHATYRRTRLSGGEVLVSLVGQPGSCAVVPPELVGANIARQVALIRPSESLSPSFLCAYISSSRGQGALLADTLGSVQKVVNLRDLKELMIPLPRYIEQQIITDFLSNSQAQVVSEQRALDKLRSLKQGLMDDLLTGRVRVNLEEAE